MARSTMQPNETGKFFSADRLYAAALAIWIVAVWGGAYFFAREAIADESAGVGGSSFLLACALATAGVITAFSVKELLGAYKRASGGQG